MRVLWLASWYPDKESPTNGDFVQRHARAVAASQPITVIHVVQGDPRRAQRHDDTVVNEQGGLREVIVHFAYRPTGILPIDKVRYEWKYRRALDKAIDEEIETHGRPDLVHVHVPMKAGHGALRLKRRYGVPYIVSEQSSEYVEASPDSYWKRTKRYQRLVAQIFREAALVTNVSLTVAETLKKIAGRNDVIQVPNTVDTGLFRCDEGWPDPFRFIHVSNLNDQKNISGLLRTFTAFAEERSDWELVLVGPTGNHLDPLLKPLKDKVMVRCTGLLPYNEVARELRRSSAFVLFSTHENFPCVIVEALCCGLPVITSTAGGSGDAIDKSNGEVVAPGDEEALLAALRRMRGGYMVHDRGAIARDAVSKYSYAVVGEMFRKAYQEVLSERLSS